MQQVIWRIPGTESTWFPDGIPIYGFGMMLFLAFILCTWLAGRRASRMILSGIGLGRYVSGPNKGADFPTGADDNEKVEGAKALIQDLAIWLFITGLAGARITYMLHHPEEGSFLGRLFDITNGGIILYGSIIGGLAGYIGYCLYVYVRRKVVLNTLRIADLAAPSVAVGIGLGRIGCLLNGCCYGHVACAECALVTPIHFPMSAPPRYLLVDKGIQTAAGFTLDEHQVDKGVRIGIVDPDSAAYKAGLRSGMVIAEINGKNLEQDGARPLKSPSDLLKDALFADWKRGQKDVVLTVEARGDEEKRLPEFRPLTVGLYPTQVYETISMTLLFLLLTAFYPYRRHDGQVMALLMMCYAVHRTLNEVLRDDVRPVGFESYSSYILFACGALLMIWATLRPRQYKSEWEELANLSN